jgi:hypothetical protein
MWFDVKRIGRVAGPVGLALILLLLMLAWTPPARAAFTFESLESGYTKADGSPAREAGTHPFAWTMAYTGATVTRNGQELPAQALKELRVQMPPGLVGAPARLAHCSHVEFLEEACPAASAVGTIVLSFFLEGRVEKELSVYNLDPSQGTVAELGFLVPPLQEPGIIHISINPSPPFNLEATISEVPQAVLIYGVSLTLNGASNDTAFLTLPRSCDGPLTTVFEAVSWEQPNETTRAAVEARDPADPSQPLPMTGCSALGFAPTTKVAATTDRAEAPSGLDLGIDVDDPGLLSPAGTAAADIHDVVVELPEGMTVNPAVAEGLGVCTAGQYLAESEPGGAGCPESSKVGTAELETPLLDEPLKGSVFVAEPDDPSSAAPGAENPFDSLLAFYLVLENPTRGVALRQAIAVRADPGTGRLTASLGDLPEVPISHLGLHLRGGPRAPFVTPGACGERPATMTLIPSSGGAAVRASETLEVGAACGARGFHPSLSAGTTNPQAGASTSLVLDLRRQDGEQELGSLSVDLPEGLSASLGSVPLCPEPAAASGGCPPAAKVGFTRVAAGAGASPAWIPAPDAQPGSVFMAGPYRGAPFSLAMALPARAGPFNLGNVLLRAPIFVDPRTGRARIEIPSLPQILHGIPIRYRDLRLVLDRPGFVHNPTSCEPSSFAASAISDTGSAATATDRFQVGNCASLQASPRIEASLLGRAGRGGHPRLRILLRPRPGDANLRQATLTLPGTALLDFRHVGAICASTAYATGSCPARSVYGRAKIWTPLLARPLEGPLYLKQAAGKLPEPVALLDGEISLELHGRLRWHHGRLQASLVGLPDVPFSRAVVTLDGGRRGLIVNSGGVCLRPRRIAVRALGHNAAESIRLMHLRARCRIGSAGP